MPRRALNQIRKLVRESAYDVTDHALDEMADDNLLLVDVETVILTAKTAREDNTDPRGTVYVIEGVAADRKTRVGVAVRFKAEDKLLIITAYKIE